MSIIYRDRYDLYYSMLNICKEESSLTHLMFKSFTSFDQVTNYSRELVDGGLLEWKDKKFKITDKGIQAIEILEELLGLVKIEKNR